MWQANTQEGIDIFTGGETNKNGGNFKTNSLYILKKYLQGVEQPIRVNSPQGGGVEPYIILKYNFLTFKICPAF